MVTFAITPETYSVEYVRRVSTTPPTTGPVFRRQINSAVSQYSGAAALRRWTLAWEYASRSDAATIEQYLVDTVGGAVAMDWTPPKAGASVRVRLTQFTTSSLTPAGGVTMSVVLEEHI